MSQAKVDKQYIDTTFSSGDSNNMKSKQIYQEENNNVIDDLAKGVEMGCIVDVAKRAPNVCVENCVYSGPDNPDANPSDAEKDEEDAYSEEFEEDKSDDEEENAKEAECECMTPDTSQKLSELECQCNVKLSKSHVTMSSKRGTGSGSAKSDFGSVSVPGTQRVNMSFSNERLREIQRHNHILLKKILCARNVQKSSIPPKEPMPLKKVVPPAALHRKRQQRQIDHDNMVLLRKIQRAKSSSLSIRR